MSGHTVSRHLVRLAMVAIVLVPGRAPAQMTLIADEREVFAKVRFADGSGLRGSGYSEPDSSHFEAAATPHTEYVEPCSEGMCVTGTVDAYAYQASDFFPSIIDFSGNTWGQWAGIYGGAYEFRSIMRLRFRIDTPFDYDLVAAVDPGGVPEWGQTRGYVELRGATSDLSIHYTQYGILEASGRLGPGEYVLEGISNGSAEDNFLLGPSYSGQWIVHPVMDSLLVAQPLDQNVACGGRATFSVTPVASPAGMTYQWMRNLTPLANGSRISGATSNTLTINDACHADSGYYSVLVTVAGSDPPLSVPSRFAHLAIATVTGTADEPVAAARAPALASPSPNPFRVSTAIRYALPQRTRLDASVFNVAGAKVCTLVDAVRSGSGIITWDGRISTGAAAPAGVYFVHVEGGTFRDTKKVVLLK